MPIAMTPRGYDAPLRRLPGMLVHQHERLVNDHLFVQLQQAAVLAQRIGDRADDELFSLDVFSVHAYGHGKRHPARTPFFSSTIAWNCHVRPRPNHTSRSVFGCLSRWNSAAPRCSNAPALSHTLVLRIAYPNARSSLNRLSGDVRHGVSIFLFLPPNSGSSPRVRAGLLRRCVLIFLARGTNGRPSRLCVTSRAPSVSRKSASTI